MGAPVLLQVHDSPERLRQGPLSTESLTDALAQAATELRAILLNVDPGVGKSYAAIVFIVSGMWRATCSFVVYACPSREHLAWVQTELLKSRVTVAVYPERDPSLCGLLDARMAELEQRQLTALASKSVCGGCPNAGKCEYRRRRSETFGDGADVILICEQLLAADPWFIMRLAKRRRAFGHKSPPFVVIDEAKASQSGFRETFTFQNIADEIVAVEGAAIPEADRQSLLRHLRSFNPWPTRSPTERTVRANLSAVQEAGIAVVGPRYRSVLPLTMSFFWRPLARWTEAGVYSVQVRPYLPVTTLFLGAYLQSGYLQERYALRRPPRQLVTGVRVRHPGTRIINLASTAACPSNLPGNMRSFALLVADLVSRNRSARTSTVLVGRKGDHARVALAAVRQALDDRGLRDVQVEPDRDRLPAKPDPCVLPLVTYGVTGLNSLSDYDCAVFVCAFYVREDHVREAAFGHLSPTQRPGFTIRHRAGRRGFDGELLHLPQAEQDRAWHALMQMEIDPVLQAFHRVRPAIHPRTVVLSCCHDLGPFLGDVVTVRTVSSLRHELGLAPAVAVRRDAQWATVRAALDGGLSMADAAGEAGVSLSTAFRLRDRFEPLRHLAPGRPRNHVRSHQRDIRDGN